MSNENSINFGYMANPLIHCEIMPFFKNKYKSLIFVGLKWKVVDCMDGVNLLVCLGHFGLFHV